MKLSTCLLLAMIFAGDASALDHTNSLTMQRSGELQELYDKRVAVARERHELVVKLYDRGGTTLRHTLDLLMKLHDAEFEAATTSGTRLEALEKMIAVAEKNHVAIASDVSKGRASTLELKEAEYAVFTARIRLIEEQRKWLLDRPGQ